MNLLENKAKTCCCIGHRKIEVSDELKKEIYDYIDNLIINENVKIFLFGSRNEFDYLCHSVVNELKGKYPEITRICYTCKSESVILEIEREKWEKTYSAIQKREVHLLGVEKEYEHKKKYTSGKGAYVERNQAMIDDSDYCLFYYNENYIVPQKHNGLGGINGLKSGTAIAYKYAERKKKIIKNFYEK